MLDQLPASDIQFQESKTLNSTDAEDFLNLPSSTSGLSDFDNNTEVGLSATVESFDCESECFDISEQSSTLSLDQNSTAHNFITKEQKCANDFRQFVVENKMNQGLVQGILKIFRPVCPSLPLSHTTLINVKHLEPFKVKVFDDDAKFVYLGIRRMLKTMLNPDLHADHTKFDVLINVDGLPLFRSSKKEFWPILMHLLVDDNIYRPFVVAIYFGKGKPKDVDSFLADFIEEFNFIKDKGLEISDKIFEFASVAFVCDIPARVHVKQIKGHTGFYGCERCNIPGFSLKHRTIFPFLFYEKRTDASFRLKTHAQHHKGDSPLCRLKGLDMIRDFVVDVMHLVYLGVMKKLITHYWQPGCGTKLSKKNLDRLSQLMMNLSSQIPEEFQRTTRSLEDLSVWKATEFRLFLLYVGPFVLKNILTSQLYRHFMLLHVSMRILNSKKLFLQETDLAQFYLERFFLTAQHIYGYSCLGMNMHLLNSLVDDVRRFGRPLDEISAFRFEDLLGKIKRRIRSGFKPLEQVCQSILREELLDFGQPKLPKIFEISSFQKYSDNYYVIKKCQYRQFKITRKEPNNVVLLNDKTLVMIENIFTTSENFDPESVKLKGKILELDGSAYMYPIDSSLLDIYKVKKNRKRSRVYFKRNR